LGKRRSLGRRRQILGRRLERALLATKPMKTSARRLVLAVLASVAPLRAHPGHDGDHGLTWELRHLAEHPLATLGWCAIAAAAVGAGAWLVRRRTQERAQSLRTSAPSRGK
jgi:hydrogenase/urease accessory protein HupE